MRRKYFVSPWCNSQQLACVWLTYFQILLFAHYWLISPLTHSLSSALFVQNDGKKKKKNEFFNLNFFSLEVNLILCLFTHLPTTLDESWLIVVGLYTQREKIYMCVIHPSHFNVIQDVNERKKTPCNLCKLLRN